jgi:cyclopropane fatty-acyl-phospholipid synthase-like methyltransferase
MSLKTAIVRQFGKPSGLVGGLAGHIMARRASNRTRNSRTVELMELQPNSRVLEIGFGPGLALAKCAAMVTKGRVVGIDHSPVMTGQAQKRLRRAGLAHRVNLQVGGVERLIDWPTGFDRIYSLNVIQFIGDKASYYRCVFDALDAGGMCFTTYQPRLDFDDPNGAARVADEVEALMNSAGFQKITRTGISAGATPAVCVSGIKLPAAN